MAENTLKKIISNKEKNVAELKKTISIESLKTKINEIKNFINFKEKIQNNIDNNKISIIAEIKKASPSAGIIIKDYDPVEIAKKYYQNKATCLSILTEEKFFQGNLLHISKVKKKINLPVLCKDFFIDPFQVHLAKSFGADSVLIILAAVTEKVAHQLYESALKLKTLETNINTTFDIHDILINHKGPLISESGIKDKEEILQITKKTKIKTFLIGESLLNNLDKNSIFSIL